MDENKKKVDEWYEKERKERPFIIAGYAGCGKTTLARKIAEMLKINNNDVVYLTPTGKASVVLKKGLPDNAKASTIHSYLYEVKELFDGTLEFKKRQKSSFTERLIIIDEISMVNEDILNDIKYLDIPLIGLGDPGQLPPVFGRNDILKNPDILLTKNFRNDGGILDLATDIRSGYPIEEEYENVKFRNSIIDDLNLIEGDYAVICRFNKTRQMLNQEIRKYLNINNNLINIGERLMILENNRDIGVVNGSIVKVKEILEIGNEEAELIVTDDNNLDLKIRVLLYNLKGLEKKRKTYHQIERNLLEVDYAYAITCHKSQGSEYDRVFVVLEGMNYEDSEKWYYTAVTRAKKELYIYKGSY